MEIIILIACILTFITTAVILVFVLLNKKRESTSLSDADFKRLKDSFNESVDSLGRMLGELLAEKNKNVLESLDKNIKSLVEKQDKLNLSNVEFQTKLLKDSQDQRDIMLKHLSESLKDFDKSIKEKLEDFKKNTNEAIKTLNDTVKENLNQIREDNSKKLDKINESVNEKLQKTLEDKLKNSFDNVIAQIGDVNKAVGEIKGLATDVGSLKNVLTNVKTKGIVGEVILGNIIKEFLTASQYEENVATKKNSSERVEFAIKLPGTKDETIYLPIDSKFPYEPYSKILESDDSEEIAKQKIVLRSNLLKYAKDVSEKYIDVPNTTDFAVIFLPLEGLYLEALNMGLFEEIQSKYKVNLTGPTTLTAFINSLQMGFRSLMIQKKSADVFKLLGAVKTEFAKFAKALEQTQKKMDDASKDLDILVGTRTRMMNSKLRQVEFIDESEAKELLIEESDE